MAFIKTAQLFVKSFTKPEVIFNNIIKQNVPISIAVNKYLDEIRNLDLNQSDIDISEFLRFPNQRFYNFNKTSLENIMISSYNICKEKGLGRNPLIYDALLKSCLYKNADLDVQCVLKDMSENQVSLDENILGHIIEYFSIRGEMNYIEILLHEMKSKGIYCSYKDKYMIVSGYIIAGQPEKAEIFIKENNLDITSHDVFYSQCYGYASIGDVASLKNTLSEMKEKNETFTARRIFKLYERLVCGNVDKSDLKNIIDLTRDELESSGGLLCASVEYLNSVDKFNYSLFLIENLIYLIYDGSRYICAFGTSRCPSAIFKEALKILIDRCFNLSYDVNIFGDMNFDKALLISLNFNEKKNCRIIHTSLINAAINGKSLFNIEKSLKFSKQCLKWEESNTLFFKTLPSMKTNGMVSDYYEIVDKFPKFKNDLLPICLLKYLCSGDIKGYSKLRSMHENFRNASPNIFYGDLAQELINNLPLSEIKNWKIEAEKCFHVKLIKNTLSNVVVNEMAKVLKNGQHKEIEQIILYMKEWNLNLSQHIINKLLNAVPGESEFIQKSIVDRLDVKNEISLAT